LINGEQCGHIFEWKPHDFTLCWKHRMCHSASYFLSLPLELRHLIYQYLLPDNNIPTGVSLATARKQYAWTAILRVNRQIHAELASFIYGGSTFTITLHTLGGISMCEAKPQPWQRGGPERSWEDEVETAIGNIWNPLLARPYFDMIRSFHVEIILDHCLRAKHLAARGHLNDLHRLVRRLHRHPIPITQLQLHIMLRVSPNMGKRAPVAVRFVVEPFSELGVTISYLQVSVKSSLVQDANGNVASHKAEYLTATFEQLLDLVQANEFIVLAGVPSWMPYLGTEKLYLRRWITRPTGVGTIPKRSPLLECYWQLELLLRRSRYRCPEEVVTDSAMVRLIDRTLIGKEKETRKKPNDFRKLWKEALRILVKCLPYDNNGGRAEVEGAIAYVNAIVARGFGDKEQEQKMNRESTFTSHAVIPSFAFLYGAVMGHGSRWTGF
jgi:hypothetical protein